MRVAQALTLLVVLAIVAGAHTATAEELRSCVVVYGDSKCHACESLLSLFNENGICYVFVDITRCGEAEYRRIVEMFSLKRALPLSVVFTESGWPGYVILAAYLNAGWWKSLFPDPRTDSITVFDLGERRKADASLAPELIEVVKRSSSTCGVASTTTATTATVTATATTATGGVERVAGSPPTAVEVVAVAAVTVAVAVMVAVAVLRGRGATK